MGGGCTSILLQRDPGRVCDVGEGRRAAGVVAVIFPATEPRVLIDIIERSESGGYLNDGEMCSNFFLIEFAEVE